MSAIQFYLWVPTVETYSQEIMSRTLKDSRAFFLLLNDKSHSHHRQGIRAKWTDSAMKNKKCKWLKYVCHSEALRRDNEGNNGTNVLADQIEC